MTLLTLALFIAGLLLITPAASAAPAPVRVEAEAAALPFSHRPTRTPTPTPTSKPTRTPTARPTTVAPTLAATQTVHHGTHGGQARSANGGAQAAGSSLGVLLGWGLGALVVALLVFGLVLVLFTRRTARKPQPAFAPRVPGPTQARLTQLHQLLPTRKAAPLVEEGDTWEPLPSGQETPAAAPLKPPRWMIEAGLLAEDTGEPPAVNPPES
jgi:hypothetical protein